MTPHSPLFCSSLKVLIFHGCTVLVFPQRSVSKLSEVVTVVSQSPGPLRPSPAAAAPEGPGSALSAHTGHTHRRLPPGAAGRHGQVRRRIKEGFIKSLHNLNPFYPHVMLSV